MRLVYFGLAVFMGVMVLILCFENIMIVSSGMMIFFETVTGTLFFPLLFIAFIGFLSGLFFGLGIMSGKNKDDDYSSVDI